MDQLAKKSGRIDVKQVSKDAIGFGARAQRDKVPERLE